MRHRHKTPQTFSLWMVDVLCCSLGSVILLWLVHAQKARTSGAGLDLKSQEVLRLEDALKQINARLAQTEQEKLDFARLLAEVRKQLSEKILKVEDLDSRLVTLTERKAALEKLLQEQVAELAALNDLLTALGKDKDSLKAESGTRQKRIDELLKQLTLLTENSDALQKKLDALAKLNESLREDAKAQGATKQKRIDDLLLQLNRLADGKDDVEKLLARRIREMEELEKKLAALGKQNTILTDDLRVSATQSEAKQKRIDEMLKQADELVKRLAAAEATIKQLERTARLLPKLEEELKGSKEKALDEETKRKLLQADLAKRLEEMAKASKDLETLLLAKQALEKKMAGLSKDLVEALAYKDRAGDGDKRLLEMKDLLGRKDEELQAAVKLLARLQGDAGRLKELMDRRFAGVTLTGRKVVFLVDVSGSMELLDENTPALGKWPGVRDTLAKIMTSMPNLEQFQLVAFSEEISHPLGKAGEWIPFDPKTSGEQVREALAKIKPSGGTNIHKAFDAAFRMRKEGLDTIYILSDGLPSDGEGLTPEQDRATLKDPSARAALLTRHLRKKLRDEWNTAQPGKERVRINAIGFFYESPDVGAFLWALSREHDGSFVGMSKP